MTIPCASIPFQWVTIALIAANVVVFLLENTPMAKRPIASFALIPIGAVPGARFGAERSWRRIRRSRFPKD